MTCKSSAGDARGGGAEGSDAAVEADSTVAASARAGVPGRAISGAAGSARLGGALEGALAFFSRMRKSPCAYSNSSSPCLDMKESNRSNCPRSIPGTENSGPWDCFFDPFISCSDFEEFPPSSCHNFGAARSHDGIIFDPDPPDALDVHARFQGYHVSSLQEPFLTSTEPGILMDFQADPVPSAMDEVTRQPLALQDASSGGIHRAGGHPSLHNGPGGIPCIQNGLVPPADEGRRLANIHSAS